MLFSFPAQSTHLLGGDITWTCNGSGEYIFQLRIFRDCSGPAISTAGQSLRVWNHPTLTQIPLLYISQIDIAPNCTQVPTGPIQIDCASGNPNAVEEFIFRSAPLVISGVPPASGWAFTWDAFSRPNCDNLFAASTYGLTLRSFIYDNNGLNGSPCYDSSPQFGSLPVYTICAGKPFVFVQNAFDPNLDSLVFEFGQPIDQISAGVFNPPVFPGIVPYNAGYSVNNQLPDASFNAGNVPATINAQNGNISFTSFTTGKFIVVSKVKSFRNGILISEVYRELLLVIIACGVNDPPIVTPPFAAGTSYSANFIAGENITFNITSTDPELLQDGSLQSNILTASSTQFGTGFTNAASGCLNAPCATLNTGLPTTGVQGVSIVFNWQSDCNHLNAGGTSTPYTFQFHFSDDFCSIPGVTNATVTINLLPPPPVLPVEIKCADVALNGDVTLTWTTPTDPYNSFVEYRVYNGGTLIATLPSLATNTFTHIGADAQNGVQTYHVQTISGCNSMNTTYSDTVNTMFLTVSNPGNGTAQLNWNPIFIPNNPTNNGLYSVYREYPAGTWTLIANLPYGQNFYFDTISICSDSINYRIETLDSIGCTSHSSIDGKTFSDLIAPYIPIIYNVTVDSTSGLVTINWNVNPAGDTEGYIILQDLGGGNIVIIDTIWGINNTSYTNPGSAAGNQSDGYLIVAIDSCWSGNPPSPNTSASSNGHYTIYLTNSLNICERSITLNWNPYINWSNGVADYTIYASENSGPFVAIASQSTLTFTHQNINRGSTYCYLVIASENGSTITSLSNKSCRFVTQPPTPLWTYLQNVSVEGGKIEVKTFNDLSFNVSGYRIERTENLSIPFSPVGMITSTINPGILIDQNADPNSRSYYYRAIVVDSCGDDALTSNLGRSIYLRVDANDLMLINTLQWNAYENWDGTLIEYRIYRSFNGVFDPTPIAIVPSTQLYYEDYVGDLLETTGEFCYYIEAVEATNSYGLAELSHSNLACVSMEPLLWVPNAFTINGNNPIFKPVTGYVDFNDYQFKIFNRWGQIIFQTNDINTGWDGKVNDKYAVEEVYVWQIEFADGFGKKFERRGFVTLIKFQQP